MPKKTLASYLKRARKEGWALPQFNFSSADQLKGIVQAAFDMKAPLLVGTSEGDSGYLGLRQAVALVEAWRRDSKIPIFLNLDHGKSPEYVRQAIEAGYDAVHFDGSALDLETNIIASRRVVQLARKNGISVVEGEFGEIPGRHSMYHKEDSIELEEGQFTDPEEARRFCKETGVDSVAVLIGTVHGVYRKNPRLDLKRLQEIRKRVQCFLVLHGGSGTPRKDLSEAIKLGVVKVNVSTQLRGAYAEALRRSLQEHPDEITPYKFLPPAVEQVRKTAEKEIQFFRSAGKI